MKSIISVLLFIISGIFFTGFPSLSVSDKAQVSRIDGYRGIWFDLGQTSEYGSKYSGGLGTYTAKHHPLAIYAEKVQKTFFVYGGTTQEDECHLLAMVSYYDHKTKLVPQPIIVHDKQNVNDPHDNPSINMDDRGYIWVFVSGRGRVRPGYIYRSLRPYEIDNFIKIREEEFTYPQPWWNKNRGFLFLFTKYTNGRELYWNNSDLQGKLWTADRKLAGMGGHYQISNAKDGRIITAFNIHPNGNVDQRTNLYFLQTDDAGMTWKTVDGLPVQPPLTNIKCSALVRDYRSEGRLVYLKDIGFDLKNNPVIFYITSSFFEPGPKGDPRFWTLAHWNNQKWNLYEITTASHNYDMGSLYLEQDGTWRIIAPTDPGPQKYGTGGEMTMWISKNMGKNWVKIKNLTETSLFNHTYARRPVHAHPEFYAFWADGNPDKLSKSNLYFTNQSGTKVWQLPYKMTDNYSSPILWKSNEK